MSFRSPHKKKSANSQKTEADSLFQKVFHDPITEIVKITGLPKLKPELEKILIEKFRLRDLVFNAKQFDEISTIIEKKAVDVEAEYRLFKELRKKEAEIQKAKYKEEIYELKEKLLKQKQELSPIEEPLQSDDPELIELFKQIREMEEKSNELLKSGLSGLEESIHANDTVADYSVHIETILTEKLIRKYKRDRFLKWVIREAIRFLTAIIGIGVALGYLVSETLKYIFIANWGWILFGLVVWNITKEYFISPWYRRVRSETERKHLAELLETIASTEVQLVVGQAVINSREERWAERRKKLVDNSQIPIK